MKKRFLHQNWIANRLLPFALRFVALTFSLASISLTALPSPSFANNELDRQFALETIGVLKAWDNVDGLFSDYVIAAFKDYFNHQSRFVLQDLSKADAVMAQSKLAYKKLIEDPEVLGRLSRSMRVQSLIRTKVWKEGPRYRFELEWLHSPKMETLATQSFNLEQMNDEKIGFVDLQGSLQRALDAMIKKVPFAGNVTGRDNDSVTVNIGMNAELRKGDTLIIATLDDVKNHPLLKSIVDWRLVPTGRLQVETVDENIAFCKVVSEEKGHQIGRYQKVVQIIPAPEVAKTPVATEDEKNPTYEVPRLGFASGGVFAGGLSHQYTTSASSTAGKTGGGLLIGARANAQLWLNREWFADLDVGFGTSGFSQQDIGSTSTAAGGASGSASMNAVRLSGGYSFLNSANLMGPKGWFKLGYHTVSYGLPISTVDLSGPSSFHGLFIGMGGDLPIRDRFGALLTLDFGVLPSAQETGFTSGPSTGATDVSFFIGGYYRFNPKMSLRAGLDVTSQTADFASGSALSNKVSSFGPSFLYYF